MEYEDTLREHRAMKERVNELVSVAKTLPHPVKVDAALKVKDEASTKVKSKERELADLNPRLDVARKAEMEAKQHLEKTRAYPFDRTTAELSTFETIATDASYYQEDLGNLRQAISEHKVAVEAKQRLNAEYEALGDEIADMVDTEVTEQELYHRKLAELKGHEASLALLGTDDVDKRIDEVAKLLAETEISLTEAQDNLTTAKNAHKDYEEKIRAAEQRLEKCRRWNDIAHDIYQQEISRALHPSFTDLAELSIEKQLEQLCYPSDVAAPLRSEIYDKLSEIFATQKASSLQNYQLMQDTLIYPADWATLAAEAGQEFGPSIDNLRMISIRYRMTLNIEGIRKQPKDAFHWVDEMIVITQAALTAKERELFETIIHNKIGAAITDHIDATEEWVRNINAMLEAFQSSSGFKVKLAWTEISTPDDQPDALKTKKLIEILRADDAVSAIYDDEIRHQLAMHFREKFEKARTDCVKDKKPFFDAIRSIFDYRDWFQFRILHQKPEFRGKWLELNSSNSGKNSGGEGAIALYSLYACAVFSRYEGAKMDAPRIIIMDELFAGMDEQNIDAMFNVLTEMDLSFLANSQYLWGTTQVLPCLQIYDFYRELDVVETTPYLWLSHTGKKNIDVEWEEYAKEAS